MDDLITFLTKRCNLLESINDKLRVSNQVHVKKPDYKSASYISTTDLNCPLCYGNYFVFRCRKFLSLPTHSRFTDSRNANTSNNSNSNEAMQCSSKNHTSNNDPTNRTPSTRPT